MRTAQEGPPNRENEDLSEEASYERRLFGLAL